MTARYPWKAGHDFVVVYTERVDPRSHDGRPVGIVTAYQE
jgi:hypothetical protein